MSLVLAAVGMAHASAVAVHGAYIDQIGIATSAICTKITQK
jgi:hypothetical protein